MELENIRMDSIVNELEEPDRDGLGVCRGGIEDVDYRASMEKGKRKTTQEVYGCSRMCRELV